MEEINLKVDELLPICEECKGKGKLENPTMKENQNGFGQKLIFSSMIDCNNCQGYGVVPTKLGKTFIEFIRLAKSRRLLP